MLTRKQCRELKRKPLAMMSCRAIPLAPTPGPAFLRPHPFVQAIGPCAAGSHRRCLFLTTERLGAVFIFDISNPFAPTFQSLAMPPQVRLPACPPGVPRLSWKCCTCASPAALWWSGWVWSGNKRRPALPHSMLSHALTPATLPPRARPMLPTRTLGSGARRASPMPGVCALLHANLQLCCVHRMLLPGDPPSFLRTHFAAHCPITLPPTRSTHSPAILSRSGARRGGCPSCWWPMKEWMVRTAGWECSASAPPSEPIRVGMNITRSSVEPAAVMPRNTAASQLAWRNADSHVHHFKPFRLPTYSGHLCISAL